MIKAGSKNYILSRNITQTQLVLENKHQLMLRMQMHHHITVRE